MTRFLLAGSSLLIVEEIINGIQSFFFKICILIDGVVYNMINVCYQIFLLLSRVRIFDDNVFSGFLNRFYVLVGVLTLFFVAYSLLKVIANPDNMTKGNMAPGKLIMNIITSIALIALLPAIFNAAYKVQDVVIDSNIIGKIIFDNATDVDIDSDSDNVVKKGGRQIASTLWGAFFYTDDGVDENNVLSPDGKSLTLARDEFASGARGFNVFTEFSSNAALSEGEPGKIHYRFFLSAIAGAFALYVVFSFVFDLGIRAVKLAVLQIIAPLPILMRIIPGRDGAFKKWTSITIGTFVEVIVRIFVVYMIAFLAGRVSDIWSSLTSGIHVSGPVSAMAKAFILMGIIAFAKQAPKMISDILGIKAGDMKLGGIRDKLREGGGFVAAGAIGGGISSAVQGAYEHGVRARNNFKNGNKKAGWGRVAASVGSFGAGLVSGGLRGGINASSAKTYSDVAVAASKAANTTAENRKFRREHPVFDEKGKFTGGTAGAHARNFARGASEWLTRENAASLKAGRTSVDEYKSAQKDLHDKYKSDMEKNGNSWKVTYDGYQLDKFGNILRDSSGKIITTSKTSTISQLKNNRDVAEQALRNFNEQEFRKDFIEKYRVASGGIDPDVTTINVAVGREKGKLASVYEESKKVYEKAVNDAAYNQEKYERTGEVSFAAKMDVSALNIDYAKGTATVIDPTKVADRVATEELAKLERAFDKHKFTLNGNIDASLSYYTRMLEIENKKSSPDPIKVKELQKSLDQIKELQKSLKDPKAYYEATDKNSKDVSAGLNKIISSIDERLAQMRDQEEKDKKDKK